MKLTIEGKPDEIKSVLKNLSATDDSQEIMKHSNDFDKQLAVLKSAANSCLVMKDFEAFTKINELIYKMNIQSY